MDTKDTNDKNSQKVVFEMADELHALKLRKEVLEQETKEVSAKIEEMDQKLSAEMAELELDKFTHLGNTYYLKTRLFASPVAGKKDEMMKALKDNGYGSLVVEQVNANTLSSFIKEFRDNNKVDLPPFLTNLVSTFEKISVGIRKG